jgi:hypothetical protein
MKTPRNRLVVLRRLAAGLGLTIGVLSAVPLLASPASAVAPTGGCWVWGGTGAGIYDITSSLAPWTDPGTADYTMTLSPAAPRPNEHVTISLTFDKGPKTPVGPVTVSGDFKFAVNGAVVTGTKSFGTVAAQSIIPGATITATFAAVDGVNAVTFNGVTYSATLGSTAPNKIDCNGQPSGVKGGSNPRTAPLATNVTASVTASGAAVDPSPLPTTSASPTASASPSATTKPSASATKKPTKSPSSTSTAAAGQSAKGKTTFACVLNPLSSKFDYPATITVSGSRAKAGDPVALVASMTNLPGIAPLPIDGQMDVTLGLTVGGKAVTLKGGDKVSAGVKAPVPVPDLTGEVDSDEDSMAIGVKSFTFDFPDMDIDADCTAPGGEAAVGTMKVGSEPVATSGGGDDGDSGTSTTGGGTLPGTGGPMSLPVIGLLAGALLLTGAGVLTLLPTVRPYRRLH